MHGTIESNFSVELRSFDALAPATGDLRALAAHATEPNVFYEPAFAFAAQPVFGPDVLAGLVWSQAAPPRLAGFFPIRIERRRFGLPVMIGWTHPYGPLGAPLVDRECAAAVIEAWLDHLAGSRHLPKLLLMPYLPAEGALAQGFDAALSRRGGKSVSFARHQRALLAPGNERAGYLKRAGYLDRAVGHKKRKELRRQRKRLADSGVVIRSVVSDPAAMARALDDFLALEAGGWKGRAGTAARQHDDVRQFMQRAVTALAGEGKAQVHRLFVDTRPIAAIITLRSGATAWCWKVAYDESFARSSPGMQLLLDVTQEVLDDATVARADSCATADHPMIDHVWRERLALADRLMGVGPGHAGTFAVARMLEGLRRAAIGSAKALRDLVRR